MKKLMLALMLMVITVATVFAAVPSTMNIQGRLLNAGSPMTGTYPAIFAIYDASTAGNLLWTESSTLDVQGGIFTATIGSIAPVPTIVFDSSPRWLDVTIDGNTLSPRLQLTTNAYAFRAQHADTANFALNAATTGDNLWSTDGTKVWMDNKTVGLNTATPASRLDVSNGDLSAGPLGEHWIFHTRYGAGNGDYLHITDQDAGGDWQWNRGLSIHQNGNIGISTTTFTNAGRPEVMIRAVNAGNAGYIGVASNDGTSSAGIRSGIGGDGSIICYQNNLQIGSTTSNGTTNFTNRLGIDANGTVAIPGNLNVGGTKCRVVETSFGSIKMNAVESGHALFMDDEPSARLVDGKCRVNLSPKFLATVTVNGQYPLMVNVTFYGPHGDWYIERDTTGFTVVDPSGSNAEFSWQAIARQKQYEDTYLDPVDTQTANK